MSVGHSATYSLPRLTDHNQIWSAGIYLSSDPCKPFWIPCLPYFRCQRQKYATRILENVTHRAIWLVCVSAASICGRSTSLMDDFNNYKLPPLYHSCLLLSSQHSDTGSFTCITPTRNTSSHMTCSPTPAPVAHFTSSHVTVTVFVTLWPWPLIFWPSGQCMPSDCRRIYAHHSWCW